MWRRTGRRGGLWLIAMTGLAMGSSGVAGQETDEKTIEERIQEHRSQPDPAPAVGAPAPNFKLKTLKGDRDVELGGFRGKKPVVLVFGSYT